ncbi:hypothetical protein KKA87_08005 [bacterium]|nr:hypothetical protein [bacterium]MBU1874564.1 hypothetical protein [bacterium]
MSINRRELLMLLSNGLIGSILLPLFSCTDQKSIINPLSDNIEELTNDQIRYAKKCIDDYFDFNLSGKRIEPVTKISKDINNIRCCYNECGYDWILVVTKYEFQNIFPSDEHYIASILLEIQGIVQGYEWRPYVLDNCKNKQLVFRLKIAKDGRYTIINTLPPICFPNSVIDHLQNIQMINARKLTSPIIHLLNIEEKVNNINLIMNSL